MTLYEIDSAIERCIDQETGEILDLTYLEQLEMERGKKIENVALYCKDLAHFVDGMKEEIDNMQKRKKAAENALKRLKGWLAMACDAKKFETPKTRVSFRQSEETVIDNEEQKSKAHTLKKSGAQLSSDSIRLYFDTFERSMTHGYSSFCCWSEWIGKIHIHEEL